MVIVYLIIAPLPTIYIISTHYLTVSIEWRGYELLKMNALPLGETGIFYTYMYMLFLILKIYICCFINNICIIFGLNVLTIVIFNDMPWDFYIKRYEIVYILGATCFLLLPDIYSNILWYSKFIGDKNTYMSNKNLIECMFFFNSYYLC
jgi:hypothetical protein